MAQDAASIGRSVLQADQVRVCGGSVKMRLDWLDKDGKFFSILSTCKGMVETRSRVLSATTSEALRRASR